MTGESASVMVLFGHGWRDGLFNFCSDEYDKLLNGREVMWMSGCAWNGVRHPVRGMNIRKLAI
jgi:hypothetical protein